MWNYKLQKKLYDQICYIAVVNNPLYQHSKNSYIKTRQIELQK